MHPPDASTGAGQHVQSDAPQKSFLKSEQLRGLKEAGSRIPELRTKWPDAFANEPQRVRPLASEAAQTITEVMGWSLPYTRAVLSVWKGRGVYCRAVLRHEERIRLDGSASDERVDDKARTQAQAQLDQIAARAERHRQKPPRPRRAALA